MNEPENGTTVNVGHVTGGGPLNRVPDHAAVQFNVRVADALSQRRITTAIDELAIEFTGDGYTAKVLGEFHSPPKRVDAATLSLQADVARAADPIGRPIAWRDTGGACDGSKLAAWGLPNIDTMGVTGGGLHSPEEFCDLNSLVPAAATVVNFIANADADSGNDADA
jgi:glutamate carboxypeptidase